MMNLMLMSTFLCVTVTFIVYALANKIKAKINHPLTNPLLITLVVMIALLVVFELDYEWYDQNTSVLEFFLTPATICLAVPLYKQRLALFQNFKAIFLGVLSGVIANFTCIFALSKLFGLSHTDYVTLLPKSITTAIAIGLSEEIGGIATITVSAIMVTGICGNAIGEYLLKLFKITNPIAKGIALGTSSHAVGTAKAIEIGEVEGAMSGLAIVITGIVTVFSTFIIYNIY